MWFLLFLFSCVMFCKYCLFVNKWQLLEWVFLLWGTFKIYFIYTLLLFRVLEILSSEPQLSMIFPVFFVKLTNIIYHLFTYTHKNNYRNKNKFYPHSSLMSSSSGGSWTCFLILFLVILNWSWLLVGEDILRSTFSS